jgi:hypothetical protein
MGNVIDLAARRDAQHTDTEPATTPPPTPTDALDGMLTAISRALKTTTLDSDARWHLIGIIMRSFGEGGLKGR